MVCFAIHYSEVKREIRVFYLSVWVLFLFFDIELLFGRRSIQSENSHGHRSFFNCIENNRKANNNFFGNN